MTIHHPDHYSVLFREIERVHGDLDPETITSVIGFSAGGPVSLCQVSGKRLYVTCELSQYPEQCLSSEGLNYEFLSLDTFDEPECIKLLSALGNLSMSSELGESHTIDISGVLPSNQVTIVQLRLHSKCTVDSKNYGIYQVVPFRSDA